MARAQKIWNGVYIIGGSDITRPEDCCIYLVEAGEELVLIDAGAGRSVKKILDNITAVGLDPQQLTHIIATHGHIDHIGGLQEIKTRLDLQVVAHELELPAIEQGKSNLTADYMYGLSYQPVQVDIVLQGNKTCLQIGTRELVCLHTPGHTPGGISVYLDVDGKRVLFGQDIHGPFNSSWGSDVQKWRQSMQELLELDADILCEGHFGVYTPREKAAAYIEHYLKIF